MDYDEINAESLVLDESFQRYCLGIDKPATAYWENWLIENPNKKSEFFKAKELYLILNGNNHLLNFEKDRSVFYDRLKIEGILNGEKEEAKVVELPIDKVSKKKFSLYRMLAAAVLLGIVVMGANMFVVNDKPVVDIADTKKIEKRNIDITPGGDKAILTLADGRQIVLDTAANGALAQQGGIKVIKIGGQISYDVQGNSTEVLYNSITTPKGGQYQLELADGSKVWLNAASSLRFPTAFAGKERTVELTGEGYFEVAHNPAMPFEVKVGEMKVEVLGTHFNINSYSDEPSVKTTLLQGRVQVKKADEHVFLNPGQQAILQPGQDKIRVAYDVDVEEVVAWKNGMIHFDGADIGMVMRQIGRWYNVDVGYSGNIGEAHLSGKVSRNLNLSQVINVLEELGIQIKMEGKKMIATPKP